MALKFKTFLITTELLLVAYILLDLYASIFVGPNDVALYPEDTIVGLNATDEDPEILVAIGNFAVEEYNRFTKSGLKLETVVRGMFAQSSYMLVIQAKDGTISESKQYAAIVLVQGNRKKLLIAFDKYNPYMDSVM